MNQKARQKTATCDALLLALQNELQEGGRLTVEAISRRAGVNKALVYRYFEGLPGLITAYASSEAFMPKAEELSQLCGPDLHLFSPRKRFALCLRAYIKALQSRPATVQILLRFPQLPLETREALAEGRKKALAPIRELFGEEEISPGVDRELAFQLLLSGVCVLLGSRRGAWMEEPQETQLLASRIQETLMSLLGE